MLSKEKTIDKEALMEHVVKPMRALKLRELTKGEAMVFMTAANLSEEQMAEMAKGIEKEQPGSTQLYQIMQKRAEHFGITIDNRSLSVLTLSGICSTPGDVVLYLCYLLGWCADKKVNKVTFDDLAESIFPMGVLPNGPDMTKVWDGQKVSGVGSDNLVDYVEAYKSIMDLIPKDTK